MLTIYVTMKNVLLRKLVMVHLTLEKKYCLETVLLSILHALIFVTHIQVNVYVKEGRGILNENYF